MAKLHTRRKRTYGIRSHSNGKKALKLSKN